MATVGLIGCGLIGTKRVEALADHDKLVGVYDINAESAKRLATGYRGDALVADSVDELLGLAPEIVIVATTHDQLAPIGSRALDSGAHVLVEKPAGIGSNEIEALRARAQSSRRKVKVGFNHRFFPGIRQTFEEVSSGKYGEVMSLRGIYGHGGRLGYENEWRHHPEVSGGGELVDQGMHLIDLSHWLAGPLPLHSAMLRTQFWETKVEDNASILLGERDSRREKSANLSVSWTEWKNRFLLEVYCRTAKFEVSGLTRSYGPQTLRIFRMAETMEPPEFETIEFGDEDASWKNEWAEFTEAIDQDRAPLGNLDDALYAWNIVEGAFLESGYDELVRG